jgi:hypothetical protein
VLQGKTRGYRHHPQLIRFQSASRPTAAVAAYLRAVQEEAVARGYRFDGSKIPRTVFKSKIRAPRGQLLYEWAHLRRKLRRRNPAWLKSLGSSPAAHPLFRVGPGPVASGERTEQLPKPRPQKPAR